MADFSVLIRSDCVVAISALPKESFRSPALQNGALLHNSHFMDLGHAASVHVRAGRGVDGGGRRRPLSGDGPGSAGVRVVASPAARGHGRGDPPPVGSPISLDLFATADNTLVPRFFARHPEPLAEGADALAPPDWGRSRCSCGCMHSECVFAFRLEGPCRSSWRRRARTACVGSPDRKSVV